MWRLHAAHVLFMRGDKYKEAAAFYEPIVRQNYHDILSVSAAVLGKLFRISVFIEKTDQEISGFFLLFC